MNAAPDKPRSAKWRRRIVLSALGGVALIGFVWFVVPQIADLGPTLRRLRGGDVWWLALAIGLQALSIGGDVALFHGVFSRPGNRITVQTSSTIALAGTAATKVLATAGAGGITLNVWALRAAGLTDAEVATGMVCLEVLSYGVYMAALAGFGFGLWTGVLPGPAPVGLTLIPALFATAVIALALSTLVAAEPLERFLSRRAAASHGRIQRVWRALVPVPRSLRQGLHAAIGMVKRHDRSRIGALAGWAFDIATLWAAFRAFGGAPPVAVLVMGYFVGTLANALPVPGGVGGVEGGLIGAFVAFGVPGSLAVLAVLAYRTISYWLPAVPGAGEYLRLRHLVDRWRSGDGTATPRASGSP